MIIYPRKMCRVCGSEKLVPVYSLGEQYPSDFVGTEDRKRFKVPIELDLCNYCTLVQARYSLPPESYYTYWYRSGVTQTMRDALMDVARRSMKTLNCKEPFIAVDIGSNDGTLLRCYDQIEHGFVIPFGVEPAKNFTVSENYRGMQYTDQFWSADAYPVTWERPKLITACGMFYDLDDPNQFVEDVAKVLHEDGIFVSQLMCLKQMLDLGDVGNLAHEHLEFYSLRSLVVLFNKYGLEIFKIEENNVNGGSYRLYARHIKSQVGGSTRGFYEALERERFMNLHVADNLRERFGRMERNRERTVSFIKGAKLLGKSVWVYGASTKGNVLLQWMGLDSTMIDGAADKSPEKWGKYTVGTNIRIVSEEEARATKPDYFLVLPYAFLPEFMEREKAWHDTGGRFIVPLPEMRIV